MNEEIWKDIEGYEGIYQVSNLGRVKSLNRRDRLNRYWKEKIMKLHRDKKGYMRVDLCKCGKQFKSLKVHRLVAKAFIPNPHNKGQVNHIDGVKNNNLVENLEWSTQEENIQHSFDMGLVSRKGEKNSQSKLTTEDVKFIRRNFKRGDNFFGVDALAQRFGVERSRINSIIRRASWKSVD